jgi:Raf kinase inhibitor-like YbhB/YbcL family protein
MAFALRSPAFESGGEIPTRFTCEGDDVSPALAWSDPPVGTRSFALVVDDPDAPDPAAPKLTWVHLVLYDLPADARGLPEALRPEGLPAGARSGTNDWKRSGYGGPCPPVGRHRCFFKLYALDVALGDRGPLAKRELERALDGHVLGRAELVGTYEKKRR